MKYLVISKNRIFGLRKKKKKKKEENISRRRRRRRQKVNDDECKCRIGLKPIESA